MPHPRSTTFAHLERTPLAERDLPPSPYRAVARTAGRHPDRPAVTFLSGGQPGAPRATLTYGQVLDGLHRTANALRGLGVEGADAVTLLLPNLPEYYLLFWGAQVAGVANPVNPLLEADHLAGLMRAAGTKVLVTLAPMPQPGLWEKAVALAPAVPGLKAIVAVDPQRAARPSPPLAQASVPAAYLHDLAAAQPGTLAFHPDDDPHRVAALFHTGGTTGRPKLARHTHQNEVFDAWACAEAIGIGPDDVMFCGLPLFHVNGITVTGLIPLMRGAHVVLGTASGYRDPTVLPNFWRIVEEHGVTAFSGVPSIYSTLLQVPSDGHDLSSLRFALCGAAPMPPALIAAFEAKTGLSILEGYGLTEATCVSTVNPPHGERKPGSIGVPLPFQELRVAVLAADGAFQRDADAGEVGVLLLRGPNVTPGYVEAEHDAGLWVEIDGARWLNTGDLARVDDDGYLFLAGRRKELIIRGGHNIDPLVIEEALMGHPQVAMAAAVPRPDAYAGELPVAYVQLKPDATATEQELLEFAERHVAERPAIPRAVRIVPALPLTAVGKIFKPQLAWEQVREELGDALDRARVEATVHVAPDPRRGILATITADPAHHPRAREVLEAYTVPFELRADA